MLYLVTMLLALFAGFTPHAHAFGPHRFDVSGGPGAPNPPAVSAPLPPQDVSGGPG